MTTRDKLIDIIKDAGCVAEAVGMKDWVIEDIADAIIESGLLKDVEPFMKHWLIITTNEYSDKPQSHLIKAPYESATVYELCQNHIGSGMRIIDVKQIEEKTFSTIKEYEYRSNSDA